MDKNFVPRPERESYLKHRRDYQLKILLPISLATLIVVALATSVGVAAGGSSPEVSLWADISLIWLIIPFMFLALVILALTIALVYGLGRLLKIGPHYTGLVQTYALWLQAEVIIWTDKIIQPVLAIRTWLDLILKHGG